VKGGRWRCTAVWETRCERDVATMRPGRVVGTFMYSGICRIGHSRGRKVIGGTPRDWGLVLYLGSRGV